MVVRPPCLLATTSRTVCVPCLLDATHIVQRPAAAAPKHRFSDFKGIVRGGFQAQMGSSKKAKGGGGGAVASDDDGKAAAKRYGLGYIAAVSFRL